MHTNAQGTYNSMVPHRVGGLALCPTGNTQVQYYFLSLASGQVVSHIYVPALPMPDDME